MAEKKDNRKDPDIDGGYAWFVLAGTFTSYVLVAGSMKAYGVIYTEMLDYYKAGTGNTSWIGGFQFLLEMLIAPFANAVCIKYGFRRIMFIGGLLFALGYVASAFVPAIEYMYLTLGFINGVGLGLLGVTTFTVIHYFFDKHQSLANGITASGSGIGQIVLPFMYTYLFNEYGLRGSLLIIGGLLFNICAMACIFIQPKLYEKNVQKETPVVEQNSEENVVTFKNKKKSYCGGLGIQFSLLKNPRFVLYAVCFSLLIINLFGSFILIAARVKSLGYDKIEEAICISISGACEIVSRIAFGWFSDRKIVKHKTLFIANSIIGGIAAVISPFFRNYVFMRIYSGVVGIFVSGSFSLMPGILMEAFGMVNFAAAMGLLFFCFTVPGLISHPILGWIAEITGDWDVAFIVSGCLLISSALLLSLEPILLRMCKKHVDVTQDKSKHAESIVDLKQDQSNGNLEQKIDVYIISSQDNNRQVQSTTTRGNTTNGDMYNTRL